MFLEKYCDAITKGTGKEAFDAGKTLSDIIAMVNRAFWLLAFGLVVLRAKAGMEAANPDSLEWYQWLAAWFCILLLGWIVPSVLAIQILLIAFRDLNGMKDAKARAKWKLGVTGIMAVLITAVALSWGLVNQDLERQELAQRQLFELQSR